MNHSRDAYLQPFKTFSNKGQICLKWVNSQEEKNSLSVIFISFCFFLACHRLISPFFWLNKSWVVGGWQTWFVQKLEIELTLMSIWTSHCSFAAALSGFCWRLTGTHVITNEWGSWPMLNVQQKSGEPFMSRDTSFWKKSFLKWTKIGPKLALKN